MMMAVFKSIIIYDFKKIFWKFRVVRHSNKDDWTPPSKKKKKNCKWLPFLFDPSNYSTNFCNSSSACFYCFVSLLTSCFSFVVELGFYLFTVFALILIFSFCTVLFVLLIEISKICFNNLLHFLSFMTYDCILGSTLLFCFLWLVEMNFVHTKFCFFFVFFECK